jgi:hypothetical protein
MTIAWYDPTNHHVSTDKNDPLFTPLGQVWPLYPKREWVGLTRDEQSAVYRSLFNATSRKDSFWVDFANAIEAKLRSKNNG